MKYHRSRHPAVTSLWMRRKASHPEAIVPNTKNTRSRKRTGSACTSRAASLARSENLIAIPPTYRQGLRPRRRREVRNATRMSAEGGRPHAAGGSVALAGGEVGVVGAHCAAHEASRGVGCATQP